MNIICVGHAAWDITIPITEFPHENTKNRYNGVIECTGGSACSASYLLAKWGLSPYYIGTVGNDVYGKKIINALNKLSVNTEFVKVVNEPSTCALILANKANGSRTILTYQNSDICSDEIISLPFTPDIMLFDGQEYVVTKDYLDKYPDLISVMDAGKVNDTNIELAKRASYVVCSRDFAEELSLEKFDFDNPSSIIGIYIKLKAQIPGVLVITLGKHGSVYEENGKLFIMPALKVDALDTTGAGDIFHGAFMYGLINKMSLTEIIRLSTVTAGLSTKYIGVQNSILSLEEIKENMNETK